DPAGAARGDEAAAGTDVVSSGAVELAVGGENRRDLRGFAGHRGWIDDDQIEGFGAERGEPIEHIGGVQRVVRVGGGRLVDELAPYEAGCVRGGGEGERAFVGDDRD